MNIRQKLRLLPEQKTLGVVSTPVSAQVHFHMQRVIRICHRFRLGFEGWRNGSSGTTSTYCGEGEKGRVVDGGLSGGMCWIIKPREARPYTPIP